MEQDQSTPQPLLIDSSGHAYLSETVKWAKFLAILGFIMCGFMVLAAFFIGTFMSMLSPMSNLEGMEGAPMPMIGRLGGGFLTVLYLIIAFVYFIPCLYLYRFADRTQRGLLGSDQYIFTSGLHQLKSLFRFMGILSIVVIGLYLLLFLGVLLFTASATAY